MPLLQDGIILELQEELHAHTQHVLALEQELQRLQFELQASQNHAAGALAAEEEERGRNAAELGQVRGGFHGLIAHSHAPCGCVLLCFGRMCMRACVCVCMGECVCAGVQLSFELPLHSTPFVCLVS